MRLMIIWGSSRPGRKGGPVSYWVKSQAKKDKRFEKIDFVDLHEMVLPFYDEPNSPYGMADAGEDYKNPEGKAWAERVGKADAVILVTPEYNHNIPAVLKNALDWVGPEWLDKPVGLISYGSASGGVYAVAALRIICAELGLVTVANAMHFTRYKSTFASGEEPSDYSEKNLEKMLDEIIRLHKAFAKN
jgi:NAD(P)H-dependent FMN reductase